MCILSGYIILNLDRIFSTKEKPSQKNNLSQGQSAFVVLTGWIVCIIANAMPFILSGEYSLSQSFFETISGLTTTGLSVVDVDDELKIILIHRSIMLFFGGVGVVLSVLFFLKDKGGLKLYAMEGHADMLAPDVLKSSRKIILIYTFYIALGIILYRICGMSFFDAFNHSIAAISTGGFSTHSASIGFFNSTSIELVTIFLMILGSTNFLIHLLLITGKFKKIINYAETKVFFIMLIIFVPILSYYFYASSVQSAQNNSFVTALFQFVSAATTTGFQTVESFNLINPVIKFLLILVMLVGGGSGSTAGGIKQYRVYIAIKDLFWTIQEGFGFKKTIYPHHVYRQEGIDTVGVNSRKNILSFIAIYILIFLIGTFILLTSGASIENCMFEIASALGTVGLSSGVVTANSPSYILWTCSIAMFLGRLEIYVFIFGVIYAIKKIFK